MHLVYIDLFLILVEIFFANGNYLCFLYKWGLSYQFYSKYFQYTHSYTCEVVLLWILVIFTLFKIETFPINFNPEMIHTTLYKKVLTMTPEDTDTISFQK